MNTRVISIGELVGDWGEPSATKLVFCFAGLAIWAVAIKIASSKKKG